MIFASGSSLINAYSQSDWFGKGIFWGLFLLSLLSWILILHKSWIFYQVRRLSHEFGILFNEKELLDLKFTRSQKTGPVEIPHPYFEIYKSMKQKVLQIISRNHFFAPNAENVLSEADLGLIESQVQTAMASQQKILEKNLFILSTIATLGPFLGLLGTVWGILLTFAELNSKGFASSNSAMLSGLSMALATTVIGLLIAIPAFVGYSYLKNAAREYRKDMEDFAQLLMASLELQYRKPDHAQKIQTPT